MRIIIRILILSILVMSSPIIIAGSINTSVITNIYQMSVTLDYDASSNNYSYRIDANNLTSSELRLTGVTANIRCADNTTVERLLAVTQYDRRLIQPSGNFSYQSGTLPNTFCRGSTPGFSSITLISSYVTVPGQRYKNIGAKSMLCPNQKDIEPLIVSFPDNGRNIRTVGEDFSISKVIATEFTDLESLAKEICNDFSTTPTEMIRFLKFEIEKKAGSFCSNSNNVSTDICINLDTIVTM